ncbi:MAG TPA: VWA domain-containing protein [Gemmataceae bacterium]|nr:VWA domain-containing protein [Gemmataceae bacterium]
MGFLAPALLAGLAALAIPPIVHLLNRRRFDVLDWGAMQFLQVSQRTRKKIFLEQFLLMLLRMGLLLLIVLGMASPWLKAPWLAKIAPPPSRDVVIVLDGSFSMGYVHDGRAAHDAAKVWAADFLNQLQAGDAVAVVHARQQPVPLVGYLSTDVELAKAAVGEAPKPRGGTNMAAAVREAVTLMKASGKGVRDVIVLTDGQRHGWADPKALERWELLAGGIPEGDLPNLWVVNVVPERPADAPNWSLAPIRASRAVASVGREVKFKTELQLHGAGVRPPGKIKVEVDGRPAGDFTPPSIADRGRIPVSVPQRFMTPGSHLVTLTIDEDAMPGDNRQDYAVEVMPTLPVLVVDGDPRGRGAEFLRDALAPPLDPTPSFLIRIVPPADFTPDMLTKPLAREATTVPRVLILANVPAIRPDQGQAIEAFLNAGGGVLVTLGQRAEAGNYNEEHYRDGRGWLPARLIDPVGDENDLAKAPRPVSASLESSAFELFKSEDPGTLAGSAYFPRHWKLEARTEGGGVPVALLSDRTPLFVEKNVGKGRVLQAAVPLDNGWRTNLTDLGDYVRLAHELVYYLAAARAGDVNLEARQPIVFRPADGERPGPVTVQPPDGPGRRLSVTEWPLVYDDTRETGVYKLTTDTGKVQYYVVQPDAGESDLTPCSDEDRAAVARLVKTTQYVLTPAEVFSKEADPESRFEFWWLLLLAVIALLAFEVWMTRRIAGAA